MLRGRRTSRPEPGQPRNRDAGYAGFCIHGFSGTPGDAAPGDLQAHRRQVADDARLIRELGGNLLRSFWMFESVLAGDPAELAVALNSVRRRDLEHQSVFMRELPDRVTHLDHCDTLLDELLAAVQSDSSSRIRLDFAALDAVVAGLQDANRESSEPVRLLLTLVAFPPRWIIEAPSDATLAAMGRGYTFASLWDRYIQFAAGVHQRVVARYAAQRPLTLCALEIVNEPDYHWTPQEVKIEGVDDDTMNPLGKYVTELQISQVPASNAPGQAFEKTGWGFQDQDACWSQVLPPTHHTRVLDYDWGRKFDWYVMCAAQLHTHVGRAIKEEAARAGVEVTTVSGSVTHNNIDYLLRMHRADPNAFANIDKIGLHPYHWVGHDVWDPHFVGVHDFADWPMADPRTYAHSFFKRFDFLGAFGHASADPGVDALIRNAFGNRALWITEFGIGSKVLGHFNEPVAEHTRFVRPRAQVGATAGYPDAVWEDLWEAFLDQVNEGWLREHGVECLVVYSLRESGHPGLDLDDDDRSNLALLRNDGGPRADPAVIGRLAALMGDLTASGGPDLSAQSEAGDRSETEARHKRTPSELYRRPWRSTTLPASAHEVKTMLSTEERQLLYWLTAHYRTGAGAIVDGGCFVGGSTVALAEGLRSNGSGDIIDVYDRFEVESYMTDFYFKDEGYSAGESFRPAFDRNVGHLADLLRVHEGDLLAEGWSGEPIEILFIDLAKSWTLNDFIVADFFPSLIPQRSIVVQQDFVYAGCPWVALTMEHLSDHFEPIGFAEYCSVVYLCRHEVPAQVERVSELPHARQIELMDRTIDRFRGYPRRVLECAKATLLIEHGDVEQARAILSRVGEESADYSVRAAIGLVSAFAEATASSVLPDG